MHRTFRTTVPGRRPIIAILAVAGALAGCATASSSKPPTTTTEAALPTTSTLPCVAQPSHTTVGGAQMTVDPGTCLRGGQVVTVTGSGLKPNSPGGLSECNSTSDQPTISVEGSQVPVSCTNPLAQAVTTSPTGTLATTFTIITGYSGPPSSGTDSAGKSAMTDAESYPCPPTTAQGSTGATCTIAFGDAGGDQLSANIGFVANAKATVTTPGSTLTPSVPIG